MLRKTVIARALTLAFATGVVGMAVTETAMAQSNATGSIHGSVPAGAQSVLVENSAIGLRRTVTPDASGRFSVSSLPIGQYKVTAMKGGAAMSSTEVETRLGAGSEAVFAGQIQAVTVTGTRRTIDMTNTTAGTNLTARQLQALPIARNVEAVIQLAPNTTRADSRFDGGASFGGGAASENSYYINGFPVVNPLTGLGASQLPFGAIAEAQVLTGAFGAEFGRSVGGVVNVITKSGTNRWEAGAMVSVEPKSLRAKSKDIYYSDTKVNPATDKTMRLKRELNEYNETQVGGYVGGPLIKDKLFMFAAYEGTKREEGLVNGFRVSTANALNGWRERDTDIKRYMGKLDWYITDEHRLELTALGDTPDVHTEDSGYDYVTGTRNGKVSGSADRRNINSNGGESTILRYIGNVTPDLTVTALVGRTESEHTNDFLGYDPNIFSTVSSPDTRAPGFSYPNPQTQTGNILAPGSKDIVKAYRLDLEYRIGKHTLRGGLDLNKVESLAAGVFKAGGGTWTYGKTDDPTVAFDVTGGQVPVLAGHGPLADQGYYVSKDLFSTVTTSYGEQSAQYLEDKYQVTDNVLVVAGLRREGFKNQNDSKTTFLEMKAMYNPRLAVSWDVFGDSSTKVFGTAGRYSNPIPTHISVRGAGRSTFTSQYYSYTGVDANGAPTGLTQLTQPLSGNNEFGQDKDVKTLAALDMKPTFQDEITIGFEKAWSPTLNFGGKVTYRHMKQTIDDFCDVRPFEKWAARNNVAITNPLWGNTCQTFNPGQDNTFYVDFVGGGQNDTLVHLTAAEQGFEKPKRYYAALDVFAEHPFRNGWYGKVTYTLSRNAGNTEGQVRSDNGQQDVAVTSVWDYPELMAGAYGRLPNDRKHQLKAYGFYEVTKEFIVGGNLLAASGRPRSCIGSAPAPGDSPNYSNQTFYCLGSDRTKNVLVPRGTVGNLPSDIRVDLNLAYKPSFLSGLSLKMDVFNLFNRQVVQNVTEAYNSGTRVNPLYQTPLSLTTARSVKLTASYDHKF